MKALLVYESRFAKTERSLAPWPTRGADGCTRLHEVARAPLAERVDLIVVGGPTDMFSLSTPSTRAEAIAQRAARSRGHEGFHVSDAAGPLLNEELERARPWGERLAAQMSHWTDAEQSYG